MMLELKEVFGLERDHNGPENKTCERVNHNIWKHKNRTNNIHVKLTLFLNEYITY